MYTRVIVKFSFLSFQFSFCHLRLNLLPSFHPCNLLFCFAGFLRDKLGSYDMAFYLAGIPPIIGGIVLCLIPWVEARNRRKQKEGLSKEHDVNQKMIELEKAQEDAKNKIGDSVL